MNTSTFNATIVAALPRPATMPLLDDWNWRPPRSSRQAVRIVHEPSPEA